MTALTTLYRMDPASLCRMIAKEYGLANGCEFANKHRLRREVIAQRLRLYRDDGRYDFERMVDTIFETDTVKIQRRKMIAVASESNLTARIINEVASLYDQPAMRTFKGDDALTTAFRARAADIELDEVMQEAQRLVFLCNEVLVWSVDRDGDVPCLDLVTPDAFDAIPHPSDKLDAVAYLIDACPSFVPDGADRTRMKHYEIWDDEFTYHLTSNGDLIGDPIAHGLGRIPGVLFHRRRPVDRLLDCRAGADITSAHLGVVLLEIMIMRLAKSQGERQPVLQGNLANLASGQSMDGERPIVLPPDVIASMLDSKTSPDHYLVAKQDKIDAIEDRYGIPRKVDGASDTGQAFIARRLKLTELRNEQRRRARVNEKLVVELMGFDPEGLRVDHAEQMVPADAAEELALLKENVRLGLDSPVAYLMRKDPDLSREEAIAMIQSNVRDWAMTIVWLRALNAPGAGDLNASGDAPTNNGAQNTGANDGSGTPVVDATYA